MIIHTLWIARRGESTPELAVAWDEYTLDSNPDGFGEDCQRAIKSYGSDLDEKRYLDIDVNEDRIMAAFNTPMLSGQVVPLTSD